MSTLRTVALVVLGAALAALLAWGGYWYGRQAPATQGGAQAAAGPGAAGASAAGAARPGGQNGGGATILVESARVGTAELPQIINTVGSLRSDESVTLRPEVAGRITAIKFQEGQRVTKGATLLRLDASTNEAEVQQARTNLQLAKSKYERAVDLSGKNFISGQARDDAKGAYELAQSALALAEARIAKTEIKAPFSGVIGLRVVSEGDYVKEGADLVNLEAIDPIKVDFRVPETFLRDMQVGQSVEVTMDALPGKTYEGRVVAVNPLIDATGRAIVVRAQVSNRDNSLRPGMFARVTVITRSKREALVVPEEALVPQGSDNYLFRIVEGKVSRVKVQVGQRRDSKVEIVAGIDKDAVIVTAGQAKLREGSAVKVAAREPAKAADSRKIAPES